VSDWVIGWLGGREPAKEEARLKNREVVGSGCAGGRRFGGGWDVVWKQFGKGGRVVGAGASRGAFCAAQSSRRPTNQT
jgi:hypothetical protein